MKQSFFLACLFEIFSQLYAQSCTSCPPLSVPTCRSSLSPYFGEVHASQPLVVYGDYLLWTAKEEGLEFALTNSGGATGFTDGDLETVSFPWNAGFRVGVGVNAFWDCCDTDASWTRFYTNPKKTIAVDSGNVATPLWGNLATAFEGPGSIEAHLKIHYSIIDWVIGRHIFTSKHFDFRPFIGATGGWINQKYAIMNATSTIPITQTIDNRCFFRCLGVKTGFSTFWDFWCGWGLYGNAAASLVYGKYEVSYDESFIGTDGIFASFENVFTATRGALQLALGLKWDADILCGRAHLWLSAGGESNLWFQMNQFIKYEIPFGSDIYTINSLNTDLTVQGLTVRARLDF